MGNGPPVFAFFDFFGGDGEPVCLDVRINGLPGQTQVANIHLLTLR